MNYAKINTHDVANGPGVRVSLFVSGCEHRCPGCFNPETWDFGYGEEFTDEKLDEILEAGKPDYIKGLSILGGEPLHDENIGYTMLLSVLWKSRYPDKPVWAYTGYRWEDIDKFYRDVVIPQFDVLVDGPFIEAEKDLNLRFRGSRNQRIIDVKKTRETGKVVLWDEEE
jgi:anaerobic ribonucleoside-triphosphate reductase activating protein